MGWQIFDYRFLMLNWCEASKCIDQKPQELPRLSTACLSLRNIIEKNMTPNRATLLGFSAILMWSSLALLTSLSGAIPPFQLAGICFMIAGILGATSWIINPGNIAHLRQPILVWLLGIGGLFGYHFFYFTALRNAPAIEAGLIAYLWPLLIVLFSTFLPGESLRANHILGAILGLVGTSLILLKDGVFSFQSQYVFGYLMACLCALIWSSYSVLSRKFSNVPTDIVTGFCLVASLLAWLCHFLWETTQWPQSYSEVIAILGLGLGPVGLAFFVWDIGVKKGNIQLLGVASYSAPLFSTLLLVLAGVGSLSWSLVAAALLITGGAVIAALKPKKGAQPAS